MPLDPSIPLGIKPPPSGLQALGNTISTAQGLTSLQAAQQQLGANQIISKAYADATDPQTGQVDFNKLQALATQGGAGAFLPDFMGKIAQQRNQQLSYDTGKLVLALKQQTDIRSRIGSLMSSPNYGKGDMTNEIIQAMGQALGAGTLPAEQAQREVASIPKEPAEQAEWIKQHFLNSLSGEAKIQAMLPQGGTVNAGGQQFFTNRDPLTGKVQLVGGVTNTLSPGEAIGRQNFVAPDGTPYSLSNAQLAGGGGGGGAPQTAGGYTGRYPSQAAPDGAGAVGNSLPPGAIQTGLSPAQQATQAAGASAQAQGSAKAAQDLHDAAADVPMRVNLLNQARQSLQGIDTGLGSDWRNNAKSFVNALSPDVAARLGYTGELKDYDEFKKILTNYASSVSGSLGSGTDARLNAAITGNANPNISKLANEDILVKTIAAEKMRQAQDYAWQNSGNTPDKFNQWQSQWNKTVSPDAFAFVEMNPSQQKEFTARLQKNGGLAKFKADLGNLVRGGIIQMPGGQ